MTGEITIIVSELESKAERFSEIYRGELEMDLGDNFSVLALSSYDKIYPSLEDNFFTIRYDGRDFGIVLPFRRKAFIGRSPVSPSIDKVYHNAKGALERKGYEVEYAVDSEWNLVKRARESSD